jgi:hypothetical protein
VAQSVTSHERLIRDMGRELVLAKCESSIKWYDGSKRRARYQFYVLQLSILVLTAITPLLILLSGLPKAVQALPTILATIAAGLQNIFNPRDRWAQAFSIEQFLEFERLKFETRTGDDYAMEIDDHQALENFVYRIESLIIEDVKSRRALLQKIQGQKNK